MLYKRNKIMTTIPSPLAELLQSQQQEITMYKWIESERAGFDIGWDRATSEWFDLHFADWVRAQRRLIDEALAASDYDTHKSSRSSVAVMA
jgi:hypothetical protein